MHWHLTAFIFGALLFFAGYRINYRRGRQPPSANQARQMITNISDEDIKTALRAARKVEAIRVHRQRQGVGRKQAKNAVEAIDASVEHVRTVG